MSWQYQLSCPAANGDGTHFVLNAISDTDAIAIATGVANKRGEAVKVMRREIDSTLNWEELAIIHPMKHTEKRTDE